MIKKLIYAKGPVTKAPVDKVNKVVRVFNLTGTTEGLFIGNLWVDCEDWIYFSFHPYSGFDFREIEPGLYEHYVVRNKHAELFQGLFHTFSDVEQMSLKDLYAKHPTKPNHWIYMGRADEMVVFSNGEKIQPLGAQAIINAHPAVAGSLVVGHPRVVTQRAIEFGACEANRNTDWNRQVPSWPAR